MPIPELTAAGVLPAGIHEATLAEVEAQFGMFNGSDERVRLFQRFEQFIQDVHFWGNVEEILVDGSFVTSKQRPSDIDLILVYRADFDLGSQVRPQEYNLINKKRARRVYGFDVFPVPSGSIEREKWVSYLSEDTRSGQEGKGLLRVTP